MSTLLSSLRHLSFNRIFSTYFDATERRLVARSVVIGALVWGVALALKRSVHWTFDEVVYWVDVSGSPWLIFFPLALGALTMTFFSRYRTSILQYYDSEGHVRPLRNVEGDGLERAIALYYASEPALEQALLGQEGTEVRWQLPTFSLAMRKFLATLATLGCGASGGLAASISLIGESLATGLFKPRHLVPMAHQVNIMYRMWDWWRSRGPDDLQTTQLSGIAAAVATLLGAPFASAFFLVPSIFLGTMLATLLAPIFGFVPIQLVIPAVTASLVSIVNVPIAATLLVTRP